MSREMQCPDRTKGRWKASLLLIGALLLTSCTQSTTGDVANPAEPDPMSDGAQNVSLVGHHDLQGRTALVVTTKSDAANGNWVYVGHHESFRDGKPLLNSITGKMEFNGTSHPGDL